MSRQAWGSKLGVVLAVAGSAVGLGNFLRFPSLAVQNGGGAFMVPYFVALLLVGIPLMWIEWTIGRYGGSRGYSTAPGMFDSMSRGNRLLRYIGVIGLFGPVAIFIYYTYIESWLLGYACLALLGRLHGLGTAEAMGKLLDSYLGVTNAGAVAFNPVSYLFFLVTFALNVVVIYFGIRGGIERVCKWAMPLLFGLAVLLTVRVFTLGTPDPAQPERNVINGLGYMWNPNFAVLFRPYAFTALGREWHIWFLNSDVWLKAAGQVFFTLSCGIGVIVTYASYLKRKDDVALSGLTAAATNEFAEVILGGSIVIPAAFVLLGPDAAGAAAQKGTFNLGFSTMPLVLDRMAFGGVLAVAWFLLLFLAGITSSISLAQPAVAFLEEEMHLPRRRAVGWFAGVTFLLCQPGILLLHRGVVDELDFWGGTFCLVLFGAAEAVLFSWIFGFDRAWAELHEGSDIRIPRVYRWIIRYVTPTFLIVLLGSWVLQARAKLFTRDPYIIGTRLMLVGLFVGLCVLVFMTFRRNRRGGEAAP